MKTSVRLKILQYVLTGSLFVLALALFETQIIRGGHYRRLGEQNRIRLIRLEAPRGNIYDRSGFLLATSRPAYHVYAIPEDFDPQDIPTMSQLLRLPEGEIRMRLSEMRQASFTPVLLKQDVTKEVAMQIEEQRPELAGVFIQVGSVRTYPLGEVGSHVVGYIGKISAEEYKTFDPSIYHLNSWIGRAGVERVFDSKLRGEDGGRQLEVDARGMPIRLLGEREPKPGSDLHLSLDGALEQRIYALVRGRKSAVLMMDLKTGELLTALSTPGFDPNAFVTPSRKTERLEIIGSQDRRLLDRGFNGLYPPGSIFKLVTAMAALETGAITPHTTFECPGYYRPGSRSRAFKCWFSEGHGRVDLYTAIERSCNVYFYNVGRLVGEKRLARYARELGFGSPVPIELPAAGGLVPDSEWKQTHYHDQWYLGETITFAIGQSYLLVSPLQILRLVAAVATDGQILRPMIMKAEPSVHQVERQKMSTRPDTFRTLRRGMLQAVASDRGTGQLVRVNFAKLAAKTGTAQAPPGDAHAWIGGFFPYEDPKIAFVVFVERGKSGGITAAQIAKRVVNIYHQLYVPAVS